MAVLPPLPRMLFWIGYVAEQVLVVNVRGFGHTRVPAVVLPAAVTTITMAAIPTW